MHCPSCGTSVPHNAIFCPDCGARINQEQDVAQEKRNRPPRATTISPSNPAEPPAPSPATRATSPQEPPKPEQAKKRKLAPIVAIAVFSIAAGIAGIVTTVVLTNIAGPSVIGITSKDVYDNKYFDFSIHRAEGFAFMNDDERQRLIDSASQTMLNIGLDEGEVEDATDAFLYDAISYNPTTGDMLGAAITRPKVSRKVSDDTMLEAAIEGFTKSLQLTNPDSSNCAKIDSTIAGRSYPGIRYTGDLQGIPVHVQFVLMRVNDHVAYICAQSPSESRLNEMLANIEPSVGLGKDDASTEADADFPSYEQGSTEGNTYKNPYFGMTYTLPDTFEAVDPAGFSADAGGSLTSNIASSPFADGMRYEFAAVNNDSGEVIIIITQGRPKSYAQLYGPDQMADLAIAGTDTDLYEQMTSSAGASDVHTTKKSYTTGEKQYPALYTTASVQGISACIAQSCIAEGDHVMYICITALDESRIPELLSLITYEQAEGKAGAPDNADAKTSNAPSTSKASGTWGTCTWSIDSNGTLVVGAGTGEDVYNGSPWSEHAHDVTAIRFEKGVVLPESCTSLCSGLDQLRTVDMSGCDPSHARNVGDMFKECAELETVKASGLVTAETFWMSSMFFRCPNLTSVDTTGWDTSGVKNMLYVFNGCSKLESVDVADWDTSSVEDMDGLFEYCSSLREVDVSRWDTSMVTNMGYLFQGCSSLQALDVSKWDTSRVETMSYMFADCSSLKELDVSKWDTSRLANTGGTFADCSGIDRLDVSHWNVSKVTDATHMFFGCSALRQLDVSGWDTSKLVEADMMFYGCDVLNRMTVGEKYVIKNPEMLPTPTSFNGKWYCLEDKSWYTPDEIVKSHKGKACTYATEETAA